MLGIFLSMGACDLGLMLVALRAVGISFSRPGSLPLCFTSSSPRRVPGVCEGLLAFDVYFSGIVNSVLARAGYLHHLIS